MREIVVVLSIVTGSAVLTSIIRMYALRGGLLDTPNARSSHEIPTPRGGGLAILITFYALVSYMYLSSALPAALFFPLLVAGGLTGLIGFIDDHEHVRRTYRLGVHVVAAAVLVYMVEPAIPLAFGAALAVPDVVTRPLAVLFITWMINLFNFMDGIDGITSAETMFVMLAAVLIAGVTAGADSPVAGVMGLLELGVAAACLGFLLWNWPPAKIFLGDVGSGFLGFVTAAIALVSAANGILPIWTWLILVGVFLIDATVTLVRRMVTGAPWREGHRCHAYQHLARRLQSHLLVTGIVTIINAGWLFPLAWYSASRPDFGWWLTLVAWTPLVILSLAGGAGRE